MGKTRWSFVVLASLMAGCLEAQSGSHDSFDVNNRICQGSSCAEIVDGIPQCEPTGPLEDVAFNETGDLVGGAQFSWVWEARRCWVSSFLVQLSLGEDPVGHAATKLEFRFASPTGSMTEGGSNGVGVNLGPGASRELVHFEAPKGEMLATGNWTLSFSAEGTGSYSALVALKYA